MPEVEIGADRETLSVEYRQLQGDLQNPSDQHAYRQRYDRHLEAVVQKERAEDHGEVQKNGGDGRGEEVAHRVQYPHAERHQAHEEDIGKHQPVQEDGDRELLRTLGEARKHQGDDLRRENDPRDGDGGHHQGECREADVGERPRLLLPFFRVPLGEGRDEGGGKRPLGEKAAQHVGDLKSGDEGVRVEPGAEQPGHHHVPQHPHDARQHGGGAQDSCGAGYIFPFRHLLP